MAKEKLGSTSRVKGHLGGSRKEAHGEYVVHTCKSLFVNH